MQASARTVAMESSDQGGRESSSPYSFESTQHSSMSLSATPSLTSTAATANTQRDGGDSEVDVSFSEVSDITQISFPSSFHTASEVEFVKYTQDVDLEKALPVKAHPKVVRFATPIAVVKSQTSVSSVSSDGRVCRICQSETGAMVRPCACAGTMGDIHETCLNQWLQTSNRGNTCEICKEEYAKSGKVIRPIWKWSKPNLKNKHLFEIVVLLLLLFSFYYNITLSSERGFAKRLQTEHPVRSYDAGRIMILILLGAMIISISHNIARRFYRYIRKQRTVHFIDSEKQSGSQ